MTCFEIILLKVKKIINLSSKTQTIFNKNNKIDPKFQSSKTK